MEWLDSVLLEAFEAATVAVPELEGSLSARRRSLISKIVPPVAIPLFYIYLGVPTR
jgi:hypothetical protein